MKNPNFLYLLVLVVLFGCGAKTTDSEVYEVEDADEPPTNFANLTSVDQNGDSLTALVGTWSIRRRGTGDQDTDETIVIAHDGTVTLERKFIDGRRNHFFKGKMAIDRGRFHVSYMLDKSKSKLSMHEYIHSAGLQPWPQSCKLSSEAMLLTQNYDTQDSTRALRSYVFFRRK